MPRQSLGVSVNKLLLHKSSLVFHVWTNIHLILAQMEWLQVHGTFMAYHIYHEKTLHMSLCQKTGLKLS